MRTYAFRITCKLAGGDFETKDGLLPLVLPGLATMRVSLIEVKSQAIWKLTVWCGGFNSEGEARTSGEPVKTALLLAGVILGVGIDVGDDRVISDAAHRADGVLDERLQPDVHGLQIVPELEGTMLFGFSRGVRVVSCITPEKFQEKVSECYGIGKPPSAKQYLAAQLYNQSHFLESAAARFITLISAIEVLAERSDSSPAIVALLDGFVDTAANTSDIEEAEGKALVSSLKHLRKESISLACRKLVSRCCGDVSAKIFTRLYSLRGTLVHTGKAPEPDELFKELRALLTLVRKLLVEDLRAN